MMTAFRSRIRRFVRADEGTVMTEAIVILPLLLWAFIALFVYWDAYRAQNTAVKASYTIADMVTREIKPVTNDYISGLKKVFDYLLGGDPSTSLIVSSVSWDEDSRRYMVEWSSARGNATALPVGQMTANLNQMPNMSDGDTVIVVQTEVDFVPAFNVGLPDSVSRVFIVTRPRRAPRIDFTTS